MRAISFCSDKDDLAILGELGASKKLNYHQRRVVLMVYKELTEQAYHARGAGLREALELIRRTPTMPFPDPGAHSWRAFAEAVHRAYVRIQQVAEEALREPGADTGDNGAQGLSGMLAERMIKLAIKIQGPYATFGPPESLARRKKSHEERIEELTGMLTTEFAECLERGTTPPDEGLALERAANWFEERGGKWDAEFIATQLRALASTQRAPVEQGRGTMDREIAFAQSLCADRQPHDWEQCEHCHYLADSLVEWESQADHAREGALLREAKWWYKEFVWPWRADDEDSDDRARKRLAALADGKEGGE